MEASETHSIPLACSTSAVSHNEPSLPDTPADVSMCCVASQRPLLEDPEQHRASQAALVPGGARCLCLGPATAEEQNTKGVPQKAIQDCAAVNGGCSLSQNPSLSPKPTADVPEDVRVVLELLPSLEMLGKNEALKAQHYTLLKLVSSLTREKEELCGQLKEMTERACSLEAALETVTSMLPQELVQAGEGMAAGLEQLVATAHRAEVLENLLDEAEEKVGWLQGQLGGPLQCLPYSVLQIQDGQLAPEDDGTSGAQISAAAPPDADCHLRHSFLAPPLLLSSPSASVHCLSSSSSHFGLEQGSPRDTVAAQTLKDHIRKEEQNCLLARRSVWAMRPIQVPWADCGEGDSGCNPRRHLAMLHAPLCGAMLGEGREAACRAPVTPWDVLEECFLKKPPEDSLLA